MLVNASAATSAIKLLYVVLGVQEGKSVLRSFHIALARVFTALSNRLLPWACISGLHLGRNVYTSGRAVIDITQVADIHFVLEFVCLCFAWVPDRENSVISQVKKSARIRLNLPKLKDWFLVQCCSSGSWFHPSIMFSRLISACWPGRIQFFPVSRLNVMHVLLRLKSVLLFFTLHLNLIIVASAGMGLRTKRGNPLATIIECDPPFPHFPGDD